MTSRTLTRGMRVLSEADSFPPIANVRVGLHNNHSQLSTAGLLLASSLIQCLDDSGQTDGIRIDRNVGTSTHNKQN